VRFYTKKITHTRNIPPLYGKGQSLSPLRRQLLQGGAMRPIAIRLDSRTRAGLELLARVTGKSRAEHAAIALSAYVQERLEDLLARGVLKPGDRAEEAQDYPERRDLLV
jgi:hypothetical protein